MVGQDKSPVIISVDVEDWPQSTLNQSLPITQRACSNTELVLDILAKHGQRAVMFILGKFAERFPDVVHRIARDGHEVASHGFAHIEIFRQTQDQFREDVYRSKALLEDIIGKPIFGYRAPDFSISTTTLWALEILAQLDFQYDSSIFPIRTKRYGINRWPAHPVRINLPSERSIIEVPLATITWLGRRWPVAGGGYHRLLPWPVIRWAMTHPSRDGQAFMYYCHPYELDTAEFWKLNSNIPLKTRLHQGLGRRTFRGKFERILKTSNVVPTSYVLRQPLLPDLSLT